MDRLSELPIDIFIKNITYLPFSDVISVCQANSKFHNYCSNTKYNNRWKNLIDNTFDSVYDYEGKLGKIWNKLGLDNGTYNYLVYVNLIKELDPITQLMIYYRQKDMDSFDDPKFNRVQRFLALFLLGDNDLIKYLPNNDYYLSFINMLQGKKIPKNTINSMMSTMADRGNVKGVKFFLDRGANVRFNFDIALRRASENGHLEVVKYLVGQGADIHVISDYPLRWASKNGHLDVVKYLVGQGSDIHAENDEALLFASMNGHLDVVKYLVEQGADIHAEDDEALRWAFQNRYMDVVNYLKSLY